MINNEHNDDRDALALRAWLSDPEAVKAVMRYLVGKKKLRRDLAEVVRQNTFVRALEAPNPPRAREHLVPWLLRIARSALHDEFRAQGRRANVEEPHDDVDVSADTQPDPFARKIAAVMHEVASASDFDAATLEMAMEKAEHEPTAAIGAARDIDPRLVRARMQRFARKVRRRLPQLGAFTVTATGMLLWYQTLHVETLTGVMSAASAPGPDAPLPALSVPRPGAEAPKEP